MYISTDTTLTATRRTDRQIWTRKPGGRWQTRATRKHAENCSNSTWKQVADKLTTSLK